MQRFHVIGHFSRPAVFCQWVADSRPKIPEIEAAIELAWASAAARPGVKLFDGPMCRLESFHADDRLVLRLSRTSYKIFLGTNLMHPEFARRFGPAALANPVGLSAALESVDGILLLGRRNASVAYYPSRIHPFAGALEPRQNLDVFEEMGRELQEELSLAGRDVAEFMCLGMAEDASLCQPELIFHVQSRLRAAAIEHRLDAAEHAAAVAIAPEPAAVEAALADATLTPIARATLLLWGRQRWGPAWFRASQGVSSRA
jgi:hypothetical protein